MSQTASGQIHAPEPNVDLGILVGLLLTDGCVTKNKIQLTNTSEELHKIFKEKLRQVFNCQHFTQWFNKQGIKNACVESKTIKDFLLTLSPTFRKKNLKMANGLQ